MSNTRHADQGGEFRQERFASSAELERGLMANLVALRCQVLDDPSDRDLIWQLQLLSHAPGGLAKVARDIIEQYPERLATLSMRKFGTEQGRVYTADQVRIVREQIESHARFPLKGEINLDRRQAAIARSNKLLAEGKSEKDADFYSGMLAMRLDSANFPTQYPAADFIRACREAAQSDLEKYLAEVCLDPLRSLRADCHGPWYFSTINETLREYFTGWIETRCKGVVVTEIGSRVYETLDYALERRCMVLIDGLPRVGKTYAVKAWCDCHPGRARYVQVPSGNDDLGFFKSIARSLGVSISRNSKAVQLRDRCEDVLRSGNLLIVMDEAHYLFRQSDYRSDLPARINWLMTALVNHGVPVALVTTPQFMRSQKVVEQKSGWTSSQFVGRIAHYEKLPDKLSLKDFEAVARHLLPEGCKWSIEVLVRYARTSDKYLAALESAITRARYLAGNAGRGAVNAMDVKQAIEGSVIPSDKGLAAALSAAKSSPRTRAAATMPLDPRGTIAAMPQSERTAPPRRSTGEDFLEVERPGASLIAPDLTES